MSFPSRLTQDALFCFLFPVSRGADDLPNRISVATSQDDFFGFVRCDFCFLIYTDFSSDIENPVIIFCYKLRIVFGFRIELSIFLFHV